MGQPSFWYARFSYVAQVLRPLGFIYEKIVAHRLKKIKPYACSIPVICVGNISVGGTGKALVPCLRLTGMQPVLIKYHPAIGKNKSDCFKT